MEHNKEKISQCTDLNMFEIASETRNFDGKKRINHSSCHTDFYSTDCKTIFNSSLLIQLHSKMAAINERITHYTEKLSLTWLRSYLSYDK